MSSFLSHNTSSEGDGRWEREDARGEDASSPPTTGSSSSCSDAIAKAVKAAAGLGPLRAAVITHIGPDWPGGRGPARMLDPDGVRHPLAKFAHVINVYLNSAFAVTIPQS